MAPTLTLYDAKELFHITAGKLDRAKLTLFSVMKNEMAFLPAWLEHHRSIGFVQFLIWDDASDDGTFSYLRGQPDVVVLHSKFGYGDVVNFSEPEGNNRELRFGVYSKIAVPHVFFDGAYVGYLDADEFLLLPPGVPSVADVVTRLETSKAASVISSVVEFFPRDVTALTQAMPKGFSGLLSAYPWFEPEPLLQLIPGEHPKITGRSKSEKLFERSGIRQEISRGRWDWLWKSSKVQGTSKFPTSPRRKTPLMRHDAQSRLVGSHHGNLPPSSEVMLTIAHFVFTAQFAAKIERARAWGAHANGARKYHFYARLLEAINDVPDGFLSERSQRYEGPEQLLTCGLMRW